MQLDLFKATATRDRAYREVMREEEGDLLRGIPVEGPEGARLGRRQRTVYGLLRRYPGGLSNMEIAHYLGWSVNRVTPRVFELRQKGLVVPGPRRPCTITGQTVQTWIAR